MPAIDLTDLRAFAGGFPHHLFDVLQAEAPVQWHPPTEHTPDGEGFWSVTSHAACAASGADLATFSSMGGGGREGGGTILEDLPIGFASGVLFNMMDDPRHQRIRRLLTPHLTPRGAGSRRGGAGPRGHRHRRGRARARRDRCRQPVDRAAAAGHGPAPRRPFRRSPPAGGVGAGLARRELRLLFAALAELVTTIELVGTPVWRRSNKHTGLHQALVRLT